VSLGLFVLGLAIGLCSGLLGIGGGVLLVPGLILLFGFSQQEAQGTSLAVLVPPIGLFAAIVYYHHGFLRLPVVGWVAAGFLLGALLGAYVVAYVPTAVLRIAFGSLLLFVGFQFLLNAFGARPATALPVLLITAFNWIFARLVHQRTTKPFMRLSPPGDDTEYHI
jgi:uncharacterized membrane protein YfcA